MPKKQFATEEIEPVFEPSSNGQEPSPVAEEVVRSNRKSILERLREEQPYMEDVEANKAETAVSWQKPTPLDWFRAHPDPAYRVQAYLITVRRSRSSYIVFGEELQHTLRRRKQGKDVTIYTWVDRYGEVCLWGVGLAPTEWNTSLRRAFVRAQEVWVRAVSNTTLQRYQFEESTKIGTPLWPEVSFDTMVTEVFEDHVIESTDHELIQALLGEA